MKYSDIQTKSADELQQLLNQLRTTLGKLKFENANSPLQKTHQFSRVKKEIAQVMTAMQAHI